jgi:hypothetical protein
METWLETIVANIGGGHYREETFEGRPHLVVSGAILGEEVIEGNRGPIFYPDDENAAVVPDWNHMPIVDDHPSSGSARTVPYLNERKLGVVLNTAHDPVSKKIKPEFWFDKERTQQLAPTVYDSILNKKPVETSSGLFMKLENKEGEHNGRGYKAISRKQRPDHVAVLPHKVGAYSVAMGGGIFANAAPDIDTETRTVLARTLAHAVNAVSGGLVLNEMSFDQVTTRLCKALASAYGKKGEYWNGWVQEVYPGYVVFYDEGKLWKVEYTASDSGVTLTGKAVEVSRTVSYEPVANAAPGQHVSNSSQETETVDKTQIITDLVSNQGYTEADKVWLNKLEAAELKQLPSKKAPVANAAPVVVQTPVQATSSLKDLVKNSDPMTQAMFADMEVTYNAELTKLVEKISTAPGNRFRKEDLEQMPVQNLRMIASLIPEPVVQNANPFGVVNLNTPLTPMFLGAAGVPAPVNNAQANNAAPQVPVLGLPTMSFGPDADAKK